MPGAYTRFRAMTSRDDLRRLLRRGGIAIWAVVGVPVLFFHAAELGAGRPPVEVSAWLAAFAIFGLSLALQTSSRRAPDRAGGLALAAGQAVAAFCMMALPPCFGLEGALLVLVAFQLGGLVSRRGALAWMVVQSAGLLTIMWLHWGWHWGVVLAGAYLPFQLMAYATTRLLAEEILAGERLAAANAGLEATRELLAQTALVAERSRISRDLHDLLGHHLTALSLNLEIASHRTEGDARTRIELAQSVTKLLLGDVRAVVGELRREEDLLDLPGALRELASGIPSPHIHLEISPSLEIPDAVAGKTVLRCAQEMVTNAVRHAHAENLWLGIRRSAGGIEIYARDDGHGAAAVQDGNGLSGMRERIEQQGGTLLVEGGPGRGFAVTAVLPLARAAS